MEKGEEKRAKTNDILECYRQITDRYPQAAFRIQNRVIAPNGRQKFQIEEQVQQQDGFGSYERISVIVDREVLIWAVEKVENEREMWGHLQRMVERYSEMVSHVQQENCGYRYATLYFDHGLKWEYTYSNGPIKA